MYIIVCILYRNFYKKEKINSQLLVQKTILLYFFYLLVYSYFWVIVFSLNRNISVDVKSF